MTFFLIGFQPIRKKPISKTTNLFFHRYLKEKNIKFGIGSGLPLNFMHRLIQQLAWDLSTFAYIGSSDELIAGRPNPVMIFEAMKKLGLKEPAKVLKIGDTKVDILEGKNAKVITALVLTGTQSQATLGDLKPDYIFDSIQDLRSII